MKKIVLVLLAVLFALSLASCSQNGATQEETTNASSAIDLDLSKLSSTMVYSEVYNMVTTPESYQGMTVKIKGTFLSGETMNGDDYYACVIQDATACCQQGMQFVPKDSYKYPDDFPSENSEIMVVGTFDYHMEDQFLIIELSDCDIVSE